MSVQPFFGAREAQPLDDMLDRATAGSMDEFIETALGANGLVDQLTPSNEVQKAMAEMLKTRSGEAVIQWLMDITIRNPPQMIGASIEQTALLSAAYQARHGVGQVILGHIAEGQKILETEQQT